MRIHYLIFDSDCPVCDTLAKTVAASTGGKLQSLSIQSSKARELLNQAYPSGWDFTPYLIVVDSEQTKAWRGVGAAVRLGILLGPRRLLRFWNLARQYGAFIPKSKTIPTHYSKARRLVLRGLIGVGLGSVLSELLGLRGSNVQTAFANHTCDACFGGCYEAGSSAGCTCHTSCGTCGPGCWPDKYHQLWCYCFGQIQPCTWLGCNGCGKCV